MGKGHVLDEAIETLERRARGALHCRRTYAPRSLSRRGHARNARSYVALLRIARAVKACDIEALDNAVLRTAEAQHNEALDIARGVRSFLEWVGRERRGGI